MADFTPPEMDLTPKCGQPPHPVSMIFHLDRMTIVYSDGREEHYSYLEWSIKVVPSYGQLSVTLETKKGDLLAELTGVSHEHRHFTISMRAGPSPMKMLRDQYNSLSKAEREGDLGQELLEKIRTLQAKLKSSEPTILSKGTRMDPAFYYFESDNFPTIPYRIPTEPIPDFKEENSPDLWDMFALSFFLKPTMTADMTEVTATIESGEYYLTGNFKDNPDAELACRIAHQIRTDPKESVLGIMPSSGQFTMEQRIIKWSFRPKN